MKTQKTTIGQYLLNTLHNKGVKHLFGVPGDYVLHFNKLIEDHPIEFINATRENTAGFMADAYARISGIGACCITYGVGINITNAVSQAFVESSPLVVISGAASQEEYLKHPKLHHLFNNPTNQKRDTTQFEIFKKITAAQAVLDNPKTAIHEIERVIEVCLTQKKPVYIEIPKDQVDQVVKQNISTPTTINKSHPDATNESLKEIESILKNCNRPVIWVGHEVQRYDLADSVLQFAEKYNIPIVSSLLGKSTIGERHPLFVGIYQGELSSPEVVDFVENSDCLFLLGVSLNEINTGMFTANLKQENLINATNHSIKINHHHFDELFFSDFINSLNHLELNVRFRSNYPASIERTKPSYTIKTGKKITTNRIFEILQNKLGLEHIVVSDIGESLFGSSELICDQNNYISNSYFGSLGFAIPASIGAQMASPKKRVVTIVGDGAFQMNCMELATAIRYNIDPIVILLNNHGYSTERPIVEGEFNNLLNWSYSELPKILKKGKGIQVTKEDDFEKALTKAFETRGEFFLIEVELSKTDFSDGLKRFGKLVSKAN